MKRTLGVAVVSVGLLSQSTVLAGAAERYAAFVVDANNGKVLFAKNADDLRFPASLTKMMTLYLLFESIKDGRNTLQTRMTVSPYAASRPATRLGLKPGSTLTAEEAILSLITLSANDAAVVIGEHLGGNERNFAQMMTAKARQLGMSRTTFRNANGLPNDTQTTTARDMATLGIALREHFPREFSYFKTKSFDFRGRTIRSHNRLVGRIDGVDGIKTGYVNASGFNLVSSLLRGDKKLVGVVMGGTSGAARDNQMAELLTKYLPQASTRSGGPLIAAASPRQGRIHADEAMPVETAKIEVPDNVPLPSRRQSINDRIAKAYGSDAGDAIARMADAQPPQRALVGKEALRAALVSPRPQPRMAIETANALAPMEAPVNRAASNGRLMPPADIPGREQPDQTITASLVEAPVPSGWIVQIAATPSRDQAMDMLADAKAKGGAALRSAQAFTQSVPSGSQTLYRARFAGFSSKDQANAACSALKKQAYNCYAVAN